MELQYASMSTNNTSLALNDQVGSESAQDYYPFGMLMPGRNISSNTYKFGYNGQEKDDDVSGSGNTNTALFWEYDTRLGRRWNLDPKPTVWVSDYACFGDSPIFFSDPLGDIIDPTNIKKDDNETYQKIKSDWEKQTGFTLIENEKTGFLEIDKSKKIQTDANGKKIGSSAARYMLKIAINSKKTFSMYKSDKSYSYSDRIANNIFINGDQIKEGMNNAIGININDVGYGMVAFHELAHPLFQVGDVQDDNLNPRKNPGANESRYINRIRKQLGYDQRTNYAIRIENYSYISFDKKTRDLLIRGYVPAKEGKFTFYLSTSPRP